MSPRRTDTAPSIPALLRHARYTYAQAMRSDLEAAGYDDIPRNGLYVIGGLALGKGDVPLAQLITELRISKQLGGQLVDNLVQRGYLDRSPDPNDRRRVVIALSGRGREAAKVQGRARARIDAALVRRIGREKVETLRQALMALATLPHEPTGDRK
jgi:DNA-binding MarR family transcriptional regulator